LKRKVAGRGRGILVVARPRDPKEVSHVPTRLMDIHGPGGRERKEKAGSKKRNLRGNRVMGEGQKTKEAKGF
jgi:hypothetical protein